MNNYIVYVKADSSGRITAINSSAFLSKTDGWVQIDSGVGDKYHHAQGNYLPLPLMTEQGAYRYKLVNGKPAERSAEELAADITALQPAPSDSDRIAALEAAMLALMEVPPSV